MNKQVEQEQDNPEGFMRFVSTTGQPILLATTRGGHSASVGTKESTKGKGTPLHPRFHRIATMQGAVPIAMADSMNWEETQRPERTRQDLIFEAVAAMVAESADDEEKQKQFFTGDGRPDARQITVRVGFTVSSSERDDAWARYEANADDED